MRKDRKPPGTSAERKAIIVAEMPREVLLFLDIEILVRCSLYFPLNKTPVS
jgi:hypothetical protein